MVVTLLLIGVVAGILSGLFGIGGGLLMVPALIVLAHFHLKLALGTSLGALVLPVGILGAYTYHQNGNLDIRAALLLGLGLFLRRLGRSAAGPRPPRGRAATDVRRAHGDRRRQAVAQSGRTVR